LAKEAPVNWEVLTNLGSAAACVATVALFLTYLIRAKSSQDKLDTTRLETMKALGESCHVHQAMLMDRMKESLERSTHAIERNNEMMGRAVQALQDRGGG